ncbi:hypothetical protein [Streptomyces sp. cg35]|uniref:hypothetical protein n=1 Tax=Streptomyces sp. cg35 TaxID=3421650 RepID=UPI003D16F529
MSQQDPGGEPPNPPDAGTPDDHPAPSDPSHRPLWVVVTALIGAAATVAAALIAAFWQSGDDRPDPPGKQTSEPKGKGGADQEANGNANAPPPSSSPTLTAGAWSDPVTVGLYSNNYDVDTLWSPYALDFKDIEVTGHRLSGSSDTAHPSRVKGMGLDPPTPGQCKEGLGGEAGPGRVNLRPGEYVCVKTTEDDYVLLKVEKDRKDNGGSLYVDVEMSLLK